MYWKGKQRDEFPESVSHWKDGARIEHFVEMDSGDKFAKILLYVVS